MKKRLRYTADGYLWQLEYRDTIKLLQEKIVLFLRLNEKLRNNIANKHRFVNNTVEAIEINLLEFSEAYRNKFIDPDMERYCLSFIELIAPVLIGFLNEVGYGALAFTFRFRYGTRKFEKIKTIMVQGENTGNQN